MDGVITNFSKRAAELMGIEEEKWTKSDREFWKKMQKAEAAGEFWPKLEVYPEAFFLLDYLRDNEIKWYILTSPSLSPHAYYGKAEWLKNMFGFHFNDIIITKHKHLCAGPDRILIDDTDKKIEDFEAAGGIGILYPRRWNKNKDIVKGHEYVLNELDKHVRI